MSAQPLPNSQNGVGQGDVGTEADACLCGQSAHTHRGGRVVRVLREVLQSAAGATGCVYQRLQHSTLSPAAVRQAAQLRWRSAVTPCCCVDGAEQGLQLHLRSATHARVAVEAAGITPLSRGVGVWAFGSGAKMRAPPTTRWARLLTTRWRRSSSRAVSLMWCKMCWTVASTVSNEACSGLLAGVCSASLSSSNL
jgi:hypothetical protein|eukprot:COSAG01_NODE_2944_length_6814_cov_144.052271_7_plen_195_part_00